MVDAITYGMNSTPNIPLVYLDKTMAASQGGFCEMAPPEGQVAETKGITLNTIKESTMRNSHKRIDCQHKFKLNYGPRNKPHSQDWYDNYLEMQAEMWAMRMCNKPELCWYRDADGITDNKTFTRDKFNEIKSIFDEGFADMVESLIKEDNKITDEGSTTYDAAINNLIATAEISLAYLNGDIKSDMEWAIEDVKEWISGITEENRFYR
jgi:hypothetical protein